MYSIFSSTSRLFSDSRKLPSSLKRTISSGCIRLSEPMNWKRMFWSFFGGCGRDILPSSMREKMFLVSWSMIFSNSSV